MIIKIISVYFLAVNLIGFAIMGYDKYKAKKNGWRIKEKTLFTIAFIGGALGVLLGMRNFHHKSKKNEFKIGIPLLLVLNLAVYIYLFTKVS